MSRPNPVRLAVATAVLLDGKKPAPQTPDDRRAKCATVACQARIPAARIFCQDCTNRLRPELLQAIADAYARGADKAEKKRLIQAAADSLRVKKTRRE